MEEKGKKNVKIVCSNMQCGYVEDKKEQETE